jgi:glycosyltransferase involved in cell wall biosynthesis
MPRVLERHPEIGLVMIGDGPEYPALHEEVRRLGIRESVAMLGRKSHEEIVRYLHPCRVAVVPSIIDSHGETEGMPTVVVEAMAAGVRVVGSAVDGIPDVLRHGDNGWLCREKDPEDLAEKILMALEDSERSQITRRALETAADFDWERVAERYFRVFQQVLGQAAR